jgi:hypothetical protein
MKQNGAPTQDDSSQIQLIKWKMLLLAQYEHLKSYNNSINTESTPLI